MIYPNFSLLDSTDIKLHLNMYNKNKYNMIALKVSEHSQYLS